MDNIRHTLLFGLALLGRLTLLPSRSPAQSSGKNGNSTYAAVRVCQDTIELPTYKEGMPDENPQFD